MNQIVNACDPIWGYDALWSKTRSFFDRAFESPRDSDMFPFWASLGLEFLGRAALAYIHPALLASANDNDSSNLLFAFGLSLKGKDIIPKSIATNEVFSRCERIIADFTTEIKSFCIGMAGRRNEELHSGGLPFVNFDHNVWLARFFISSKVLLEFQQKSLVDLLDQVEADAAQKYIDAELDDTAKQVNQLIYEHKAIWDAKSPEQKMSLATLATRTAMAYLGHVTECPSCGSSGLITGESISQKEPTMEDGEIVIRENMLPIAFRCEACGLSINGHSKLYAAGLGRVFIKSISMDPVEYYGDIWPPIEDEYNNE